MELTWQGSPEAREGWCDGFHIGLVLRSRRGWSALVRHAPVDGPPLYETAEEAMAAVEAAVADVPPPTRKPPAPERRRFVRNQGPGHAPHPGTLRRPPS